MTCSYNRSNYLTAEFFQALARIESKIDRDVVHAANLELQNKVTQLEAENLELKKENEELSRLVRAYTT